MKRLLVAGFITSYIAALTYGNLCHILRYNMTAHPMMYMIIWDMFCGWSAFDYRIHIFAEGDSGKYYDLSPAPWGELQPFGYLGRENYDQFNNHSGTIAMNVLRHTRHEPVSRIFVVEESWAKKFNLPDAIWKMRYDDPKNPQSYYRLRSVYMPDGTLAKSFTAFVFDQSERMVLTNPRLVEDARRGRAMFVIDNRKAMDMTIDSDAPGAGLPARVLPAESGN